VSLGVRGPSLSIYLKFRIEILYLVPVVKICTVPSRIVFNTLG